MYVFDWKYEVVEVCFFFDVVVIGGLGDECDLVGGYCFVEGVEYWLVVYWLWGWNGCVWIVYWGGSDGV